MFWEEAALSSTTSDEPRRGDVWIVNLDPTIGAEIKKSRPAIIISSDGVGQLPIKLIAPITEWKPQFDRNLWHVRVDPDDSNGLTKVPTVGTLQLRGVDTRRLTRKVGRLSAALMEEIAASIALVIEYG